jgi:hypothetical protein
MTTPLRRQLSNAGVDGRRTRATTVKEARGLLLANGFVFNGDIVSAIVYLETLPGYDVRDVGEVSMADAIAKMEELSIEELLDANETLLDHLGDVLAGDHDKSALPSYVATCAIYATFIVPHLVCKARREACACKREQQKLF